MTIKVLHAGYFFIIGPAKHFFSVNCDHFLTNQFEHIFGCSKELSHRDGSFEYPQRKFWLRNKTNNFLVRTLIWSLEACDMLLLCLK